MFTDALKQVSTCIAYGHPDGEAGEWGDTAFAALLSAQEALKSLINQGWIPVEKELPDVPEFHMQAANRYFLVSAGGKVELAMHFGGRVHPDGNRWDNDPDFHHLRAWVGATRAGSYPSLVIHDVEAWQPLPACFVP